MSSATLPRRNQYRLRAKLRYATFLLGVVLCLQSGAQFLAIGQCETKATVPVFNGDLLPLPPHQTDPWRPPATSLPEKFVTATATLFDQGLADPRACEYRETEVVVGYIWGGTGVCKTHGWVLPKATRNQTQRFGIGWNGLVYPLLSVGQLADLNEDVLKVVKADEELRARYPIENPNFPFYRFRPALSNSTSISESTLLPLKASLLLRLGQTRLAEQVWTTWTAGMNPSVNDDAIHLRDPYLMLAADWTWALFDRAVDAHMRGDDKLSLLSARFLAPVGTSVEREAAQRGYLVPERFIADPETRALYLTFLEPLSRLLQDEERRVKEGSNSGKQTLADDLRITGKGARVEALVRRLDEVRVRQDGQPGGVDLKESEIMKALIAEGDAAVEPLLNVLENDPRLTRSVSFSRDFHWSRHLIGVYEAAYVALRQILKTDEFAVGTVRKSLGRGSLEERRAVAAQIRTYLTEYGGLSLEERWYRILKDDHASADQWLEAAAFIVQRSNYNYLPPAWAFSDSRAPRPGDTFHLRGEPLRSKSGPTVSELLRRRMKDLAERAASENSELLLEKAVNLALGLGTWDGPASIPELKGLMSALVHQYATVSGGELSKRPHLSGKIVNLTLKRFELGDEQALSEYATWLRTVRPADTEYVTVFLFEPAVGNSTAPEVNLAISWMFLDSASPWVPLVPRKVDYYNIDTAELVERLMEFPGFREQLGRNLEDKSIVGTLVPRPAGPNDQYDLKVENNIAAVAAGAPNSSSSTVKISQNDPKAPQPPLQPVTFRAADVYAWKLRGYEGAPRIELYWNEKERDAAIAECVVFLREHKGKFIYSPERAYKYTH